MLHASETWALSAAAFNRLRRNDRAMIRWMCSVSTMDEVSSNELLTRLGIKDIEMVLRSRRLRWFGHVERSVGGINKARQIQVAGNKGRGRLRKTWDETVRRDREALGVLQVHPYDRRAWKGHLRSAKQDPPLLEGLI